MRILITTDGSGYSEVAARTLAALKPPTGTEYTVLHVRQDPHYLATPAVPPAYVHEWHRVQHELQAEARETAERAVADSAAILSELEGVLQTLIIDGHVADGIIRVGEEMSADLTVIASQGLTGSEVFPLGSVAQKVKKYAVGSVLLVKSRSEGHHPKASKILLATDGSEYALEAARLLSLFGLSPDAEVTLLSVVRNPAGVSPFSSSPEIVDKIRKADREATYGVIEETRAHLNTRAKVVADVREGDAAEQILRAGSEMNADLIVVGSKGLSGVKRFLLGSVSERVCRHSDRSVLLVKTRPRGRSI